VGHLVGTAACAFEYRFHLDNVANRVSYRTSQGLAAVELEAGGHVGFLCGNHL
jgi:hypothetical protein